MIGNILAVGGSLIAVFAITVGYLFPLWPAQGVDLIRVNSRVEMFEYFGVVLAITGAFLISRQTTSRTRQFRILLLCSFIVVLAALSAYRGNPELRVASARAKTIVPAKYHFSTDWVSKHKSIWARLLADFKGKPNIQALEVGSFEGRSALWFLENILTGENSTITCIDIWVGNYEKLFDDNIEAYGQPGKVIKIKGRSDQALRQLKTQTYDFIYIDGSHFAKDVLVDAVLAWDLLKPGGIMIFDDYNQAGLRSWLVVNETAKIALNAFVKVFGPYIEIIHKDIQLAVKKKDPKQVDIETSKPLKSFILGVQHWLG